MSDTLSRFQKFHYRFPFLANLYRFIRINTRVYPGFLLNTSRKAGINRRILGLTNDRVVFPERHKLSVVAIMKEEERFLDEWIAFYLCMGVEHFYLYNNGDYEKSQKILGKYIDRGLVTHIPFPDSEELPYNPKKKERKKENNIQYLAYGDFLIRYKQNTDWILKVDLDEFVFPEADSGFETIVDYIDSLDATAYMTIRSFYFGSSGHEESPDDLVIASYRERRPEHTTYKAMARAKNILPQNYSTCHDFNLKVTNRRNIILDPTLRLNHYFTKSREDFAIKVNCFSFAGKEFDRFHDFNNQPMTTDEGDIMRFIPKVRAILDEYGVEANPAPIRDQTP